MQSLRTIQKRNHLRKWKLLHLFGLYRDKDDNGKTEATDLDDAFRVHALKGLVLKTHCKKGSWHNTKCIAYVMNHQNRTFACLRLQAVFKSNRGLLNFPSH